MLATLAVCDYFERARTCPYSFHIYVLRPLDTMSCFDRTDKLRS